MPSSDVTVHLVNDNSNINTKLHNMGNDWQVTLSTGKVKTVFFLLNVHYLFISVGLLWKNHFILDASFIITTSLSIPGPVTTSESSTCLCDLCPPLTTQSLTSGWVNHFLTVYVVLCHFRLLTYVSQFNLQCLHLVETVKRYLCH